MIDNEGRRRVATNGDMLIRGVGIVSDANGPFALRFRIDGIDHLVTLNTNVWRVQWEDVFDAEGWEYGMVIDDGTPTAAWDEYPGDEARANIEEGDGVRMVRRRPAGPWGNF